MEAEAVQGGERTVSCDRVVIDSTTLVEMTTAVEVVVISVVGDLVLVILLIDLTVEEILVVGQVARLLSPVNVLQTVVVTTLVAAELKRGKPRATKARVNFILAHDGMLCL